MPRTTDADTTELAKALRANEMNYEVMVKHILYEFEVTQKYVAYKYILKGMNLMRENENYVEHITKTLYIDIAKEYNTSVACVERGIRTTIEIMWRNLQHRLGNLLL